jgi:hypothetical protein
MEINDEPRAERSFRSFAGGPQRAADRELPLIVISALPRYLFLQRYRNNTPHPTEFTFRFLAESLPKYSRLSLQIFSV